MCQSFKHLPIWCDISCQHLEELSEGSGRTISTAALLSPMSGKVDMNAEKHPENISVLRAPGLLLHRVIGEFPGKGKM